MGNQESGQKDTVQMHAIVKGNVQGVFFRSETQKAAREMGIVGTVRNVPDGTVEIYAQGTRAQLDRLMEKLSSSSGPGRVEDVSKDFSAPDREFSDFSIIH